MKAQDIVKAVAILRPGAGYSMIEDDYSSIQWANLEGNAPTIKEIQDTIAQIEIDEVAKAQADAAAKAALLEKLGITADEAALLLGWAILLTTPPTTVTVGGGGGGGLVSANGGSGSNGAVLIYY